MHGLKKQRHRQGPPLLLGHRQPIFGHSWQNGVAERISDKILVTITSVMPPCQDLSKQEPRSFPALEGAQEAAAPFVSTTLGRAAGRCHKNNAVGALHSMHSTRVPHKRRK